MSPGKRFLLIVGIVAILGWIAGNVLFGPPGYTPEYHEKYKAEHEHYLNVIKSEPYKLYLERPGLHGPGTAGAPATLERDIRFVEQYEARHEFIEEQHRMERYGLFFDFFNGALVVIVVVYFARKPMRNWMDHEIGEMRENLDAARQHREAAEKELAEASYHLEHLHEDEAGIDLQTTQRLEREMAELAQANHYSFGLMQRELTDRRQQEYVRAQERLQRELVEAAIEKLQNQLKKEPSPNLQAQLVEDFALALERAQ